MRMAAGFGSRGPSSNPMTQRRSTQAGGAARARARARARERGGGMVLMAAAVMVALLGLTIAPSASAALPGGQAPSRGRGSFVPPPPPRGQQQDEQQGAQQQQPPLPPQPAAHQVQTRPWGPASGSYTYQRYYTSQAAAGAGGEGRGSEVLYPRIMRTVGNTGVCVLFMILTARVVHLYELVDQISGAFRRYLMTLPVVGLLCANLVGVLLSLVQSFSRNSRLKTRLKAILTLNGFAEVLMVAYNSLRLVLGNDKWTPREAYVGRIFTSTWILTIVFAFSTSRWDNNAFGGTT